MRQLLWQVSWQSAHSPLPLHLQVVDQMAVAQVVAVKKWRKVLVKELAHVKVKALAKIVQRKNVQNQVVKQDVKAKQVAKVSQAVRAKVDHTITTTAVITIN